MSLQFYLFKGPEFGEKNEAILELKAQAKKKYPSIEIKSFYVMETPVSEWIGELSNGSLFSEGKFFTVKNAELIKNKDEIQLIESWAKASEAEGLDDCYLILVSDENSVDSKLEKIIAKDKVKVFWEMFENRKIPWLMEYFQKNGYKIHEDAAQEILNMVENNTEALKNECSRFFIVFAQDHFILPEDVDKVLEHNREESAFTLFDAMADSKNPVSARLENSLEILQKIRQSAAKDASSIGLIAGLLYSFRQLKKWHILQESGSVSEASLKSAGFYSKTQQNKFRSAAKIWNYQQVQRIIALLSSTDMQIRSEGNALEDHLASMMIYQIVVKNGSRLLDYSTEF
ncbi:MAG: DNA polymerase III subunit delta [Treponemataceae bacterium]|nr:DNA polymerase III subunit delta [Treponemataceae bacterium]